MDDTSERETPSSNRSSQIIVLSFLLLAFILLYSTNQIEETGPLVWKHNVWYEKLFYRDEVPEEYREYIQFSARVINRSFPYIAETSYPSSDTASTEIGLKGFLALERLEPSDDNVSRYFIYSEVFGLYDVPRRLNESISGITMSDLLLADYVEVSGYSFLVSSGPTTLHRIFCILDLEAVYSVGATRPEVGVFIEEANYTVSGQEAVDIVLDMRNFEKIYKIEAFPSSRMRLGNGTRIDKRVWWLNIFVSPPEGIGGNIFNAFVDVNTGEVYDLYMVHWSSG
jgi:hypothetical protein